MRIILTVIFILMAGIVHADVFLVIDSSTKDVISISPKDDAVVEQGQEKIKMADDFRDIKLDEEPTMYRYVNNRLVKNLSKISDHQNQIIRGTERFQDMQIIQKYKNKTACEALVAQGVVFKQIKCTDFD